VNSRLLALVALVAIAGCQSGPPAIAWNSDGCDFCRMTISDRQYAAAATTATGRTVKFDAIECLAGWTAAQTSAPKAIWVTDAEAPGSLIPVESARFFRAASGRSPMGKGFVAVAATRDMQAMAAVYGDGPFTWAAVRDTLQHAATSPARPTAGGQ
jgi:copper chaperone NosL